MKIEKVNDHQIRCTLTKADLADRELKNQRACLWYGKSKKPFPRHDAAGIPEIWF